MSAIAFCGNLGKRSADGRVRVYTREQCEGPLGGVWHGNGECTKKEGGSWSWDCRGLNDFPDPVPVASADPKTASAPKDAYADSGSGSGNMMLYVAAAAAVGAYFYMKKK